MLSEGVKVIACSRTLEQCSPRNDGDILIFCDQADDEMMGRRGIRETCDVEIIIIILSLISIEFVNSTR